jgi:hypothetical protein
MIADWRLKQGNLYRTAEALNNAGVDTDSKTGNDYMLRCAKTALKLLRQGNVAYYSSYSQHDLFAKDADAHSRGKTTNNSNPKDVIEVLEKFEVKISRKDYVLFAQDALYGLLAAMKSACMAASRPGKYRDEAIAEVKRLETLAGIPHGGDSRYSVSGERSIEEEAAYSYYCFRALTSARK